jgi:hypothetical protein
MTPFKTETTLSQDGSLTLEHLPFRAGDKVEVTVLPAPARLEKDPEFPLRGKVIRYIDPTEPVV